MSDLQQTPSQEQDHEAPLPEELRRGPIAWMAQRSVASNLLMSNLTSWPVYSVQDADTL